MEIYTHIVPGEGQTIPWGHFTFTKEIFWYVNLVIRCNFLSWGVINNTNFVELESPMLQVSLNRCLKGFFFILPRLPSWSYDLNHLYKFSSSVYRVTDEALIAETAVWPIFFLMNIFFALRGSKLVIIICCHCSWMLCRVAAVNSLPALIYCADNILLLVL